ncbi:hypothetical protein AV521_15500 [Streptomyces sp. IMTB 2501]|nr:hypothetical protein AV521_15500 [Streptomyces sp. IMTB 2501]
MAAVDAVVHVGEDAELLPQQSAMRRAVRAAQAHATSERRLSATGPNGERRPAAIRSGQSSHASATSTLCWSR